MRAEGDWSPTPQQLLCLDCHRAATLALCHIASRPFPCALLYECRDGAEVHIDYKSQFSDQRRKRKAKSKVPKPSRAAAAAEPIDLDEYGEAEEQWNGSAGAGSGHSEGIGDDLQGSQDVMEESEGEGDQSQQQKHTSCWRSEGHHKVWH